MPRQLLILLCAQVACTDNNYPLTAVRIQPHRQVLENMTARSAVLLVHNPDLC